MVDVDLVEDVEDVPQATPGRVPPADVRRGRPAARVWSALGVLAVVAVVAVGLGEAEDRRRADRIAALAGLPGYLETVAEPLEPAWHVDAVAWLGRTPTRLLVVPGADGTPGAEAAVAAVDLRTGQEVWRRAVPGEACAVVPEDPGGELPEVAAVVCVPSPAPAAAGQVTVLDPTTGEPARSLDVAPATTAELVDGLVVLATATRSGAAGVRAWDPLTGTTVAGPRPGGAVRPRAEVETLDLPGGRQARWGRDHFGRPKDVVVVDREAGTRVAVPGVPWLAPVRDGTAEDVVVVRRTLDQHLVGVDARSGQLRWDLANVPWLEPSVQVGGVVVAVSPTRVVALDVATGLRLWNHPTASGSWHVLTDGVVVLAPSDEAEAPALVARRLTTGDEAWRVALPDGAVALAEVDGATVLVLTASGLVALR